MSAFTPPLLFESHPNLAFDVPRLMAIVNATPDSFSDGGLLYKKDRIDRDATLFRLQQVVAEGAEIIDIGGESTRPGASAISVQEEMDRVLPVLELAAAETDLAISIDTSSPELMREAAKKGAHLINDVRALSRPGAVEAAASTGLPVCLMHMQGAPASMQVSPNYKDVVRDVVCYLQSRIDACVNAGIDSTRICIDPGFGFGKTLEHNLLLLKYLSELKKLGFPLLVGLSRKSMIDHLLKRDLKDRLPASLALGLMSLERGANILRVHDIRETRDIIDAFVAVRYCD
ncbi:Dihydropteroate synthase [gamma proteobacterium IMCC1989]|nr:Dihydropteroate synthase [gamma proteobacterium IMCC1989]